MNDQATKLRCNTTVGVLASSLGHINDLKSVPFNPYYSQHKTRRSFFSYRKLKCSGGKYLRRSYKVAAKAFFSGRR